MDSQQRLKIAIEKAKAGHELSARDILLDIVQSEPDNKLAWLWLVGLLDERADIIIACENILRIDPSDARVKEHLSTLLAEDAYINAEKVHDFLTSAEQSLRSGDVDVALAYLYDVIVLAPQNEKAWKLLAKYSPELEDQVFALQQVAELDPENVEKRTLYERWAYYLDHPFELAAFYEERGMLDMAIGVYKKMGLTAKGSRTWGRLVRELERLEYLQHEKIAHVSPVFSVLRLTAGMPILFFFLLILHTGYDLDYLTVPMGLGFFIVLGGSFLMALASIRSEHKIWRWLGNAAGRAKGPVRWAVGAVGFVIMMTPFVLLSKDAMQRLMDMILLLL